VPLLLLLLLGHPAAAPDEERAAALFFPPPPARRAGGGRRQEGKPSSRNHHPPAAAGPKARRKAQQLAGTTTRRPGRVPPLHAALTLQYSTVLPVPVLYARGLLLLHACMRCSMQLHIWAAEALTPSPYVGSSYACRLPAVGGPITLGHSCLPY